MSRRGVVAGRFSVGRRLAGGTAAILVLAALAIGPLAAPVAAIGLVANDDSLTVTHDHIAVVATPGVLANDITLLGTTAVLDGAPSHGTVQLRSDGGYRYTPDPGFVGSDSFTYHDTVALGLPSLSAVVRITVTNATPVAANDTYSATTGVTLTVPAPGVLANDTDGDGDALTATIVSSGGNGNVSFAANGGFTFKSGGSFTGPRTFTYRVSDGIASSAVATVTINVQPVKPSPTPVPTPVPTPLPTPVPTPVPTPTLPLPTLPLPTLPLPSLPLPTLPLPTLPLPTLPLPTLFPTPRPTPSPDPTTGGTPVPSERPTSDPSASTAPTTEPSGSADPASPAGGSPGVASPTPEPSPSGTIGAGTIGAGSIGSGGSAPPGAGGGLTVGQDRPAPIDGLVDPGVVGLDGLIEWAVPSLVLSVPGLLLILAVLAQATVGTLWLPVIRRWLGAFGVRRNRSAGRAAG